MRKYLLAGAAALIIAAPAAAKDGAGYIGVEGGVLFPKSQSVDGSVNFTDPLVTDIGDTRVAKFKSKTGYDIDAIAGYDFGMFRLEGELGYKRAKLKSGTVNTAFLTALNTGSGTVFTADDVDVNGRTSVLSGMVNGLLDFGDDNGISGSIGAGVGRAKVKQFGDSDSAWAYQLIAGVRTAVSENIDIGLKYRYFRTGKLNFNDDFAFAGGTGSGGTVFFDGSNKFSSHSLLASLIFNLGTAAVAAPPPPPPPVYVEPAAPATQTCPDGSVILATSMCAAPPPPPPPAPVERGERGQ